MTMIVTPNVTSRVPSRARSARFDGKASNRYNYTEPLPRTAALAVYYFYPIGNWEMVMLPLGERGLIARLWTDHTLDTGLSLVTFFCLAWSFGSFDFVLPLAGL